MSFARALSLSFSPLLAFGGLGLFWGAFGAQVPVLKAGIGVADGPFGVALLCGAVGALVSMYIAPKFDMGMGRGAIRYAAMLVAVAFLLPGLAPNLPLFAAAMFCCGASSGLLDVVMNARLTRIEAEHSTGLMSLNHAAYSFVYAGAAFAAGFTREAGIAPVAVFAGLGGLMLALSVGMVTAAPEDTPDDAPAGGSYLGVAIWTGIITLVAFMTEQSTESWSALHIERTLGGGAAEGALGPALLGLTMGIGRLAGHFATPRGRERASILVAALVTALGTTLAAVAPNQAVAYLGFAILGMGVSVIAPLAIALAGQIVRPRDRALAVSRTVMIGYAGFFIGPPLMGFVSEALTLRASYGVVALLMLLSPLCLLPLRARASAQVSPQAPPPTLRQNPSE